MSTFRPARTLQLTCDGCGANFEVEQGYSGPMLCDVCADPDPRAHKTDSMRAPSTADLLQQISKRTASIERMVRLLYNIVVFQIMIAIAAGLLALFSMFARH